MTRVRRAGARWRVLAHEWRDRRTREGRTEYGTPHTITSDGRATSDDTTTVLPGTEIDEVVVGSWLHLEQMDVGEWHLQVGGVVLSISADRDGRPTRVSVHGPGDYDDPVAGCVYGLSWSGREAADPAADRYLPPGWSRPTLHVAVDNAVDDGDPEAVGALLGLLAGYRPGMGRRAAGGAR